MKESVTSNQSTCNSPKANSYNPEFMKEAIRIAVENVENGTGGPFGAVVVRDGKIIATSGNTVVPDNDPTAHAEVNAIRKACKQLDSFQLKGCEIYSSCEPCPMCLGFTGRDRNGCIMLVRRRMPLSGDLMILLSIKRSCWMVLCVVSRLRINEKRVQGRNSGFGRRPIIKRDTKSVKSS